MYRIGMPKQQTFCIPRLLAPLRPQICQKNIGIKCGHQQIYTQGDTHAQTTFESHTRFHGKHHRPMILGCLLQTRPRRTSPDLKIIVSLSNSAAEECHLQSLWALWGFAVRRYTPAQSPNTHKGTAHLQRTYYSLPRTIVVKGLQSLGGHYEAGCIKTPRALEDMWGHPCR